MYRSTLIDRAARELAVEFPELLGADRETGKGAATALINLIDVLSARGGFTKPSDQQAAIRVNRAQLDAQGRRFAGRLNKPDIGFSYGMGSNRRRMNIEIDTDDKSSARHQAVVNQRDPDARNLFLKVRPWTGVVESGLLRVPARRGARAAPMRKLGGHELRRLNDALTAARTGTLTPVSARGLALLPVPVLSTTTPSARRPSAGRSLQSRELDDELDDELAYEDELDGLTPALAWAG